MTSQLAFAAVNGVVLGMAVFLVAAGLTLVFGILRIFNFAHGSFFMIGAYLAHALMGREPSSVWFYALASLAAAAVIGAINVILMTALCTVATFIYNMCADLVGGLEVTLSERD